MEALGFRPIVRAEDVAVMGITEVVRHMPRIYRRIPAAAAIRSPQEKPDAAMLIDFPDVNLSLARRLKRLGRAGDLLRQPAAVGVEEVPHPQRAALRGSDADHLSFRGALLSRPRRRGGIRRPSAGRVPTADGQPRANSLARRSWIRQKPGSACCPAAAGRRSG